MSLVRNVTNFLCDEHNLINVYFNNIHISQILKLKSLSDTEASVLLLDKSLLKIKGSNFKVIKMDKSELLIGGQLEKLEIIR